MLMLRTHCNYVKKYLWIYLLSCSWMSHVLFSDNDTTQGEFNLPNLSASLYAWDEYDIFMTWSFNLFFMKLFTHSRDEIAGFMIIGLRLQKVCISEGNVSLLVYKQLTYLKSHCFEVLGKCNVTILRNAAFLRNQQKQIYLFVCFKKWRIFNLLFAFKPLICSDSMLAKRYHV